MEDPQRLAYLFYRYYEKKCTQSEKDELFLLLQNPAHDETLKRLIDETWSNHSIVNKQSPQSADRILEYITRHQPPVVLPLPSPVRRSWRFLKYAAAIIPLAGISLCLHFRRQHSRGEQVIAKMQRSAEDQCLTLSDGSKVLLHKNAHLNFEPLFSKNTREVTLTGEAYFDIRRDERPFIVHTGNITTTVLGTAFNIDAHEKDLVITVVKGKIRVDNGTGDLCILKRNEQVTIDGVHHLLKKTSVDAGEIITWKKPYLLFNDVSMKDAIAELGQRFHANITLTNPALENCHVTATFTQGESLEQIIRVLSKINNMEYKSTASDSFELSGEGCK